MPGVSYRSAIFDGWIYMPHNDGLSIVDARDPTNPQVVRTISGLGKGEATMATYSGGYVYLGGNQARAAGGKGIIRVIDVHDPLRSKVVGSFVGSFQQSVKAGLSVSQKWIYTWNSAGTVWRSDISNPEIVRLGSTVMSSLTSVDSGSIDIFATENWVYVVAGAFPPSLFIFDANNLHTTWYGRIVLDGEFKFNVVYVEADKAYIAGRTGLHIFDVSNKMAPRWISSSNHTYYPSEPVGMAISNGRAYLACFVGGLHVIDVTDPEHLRIEKIYDLPDRADHVEISGDIAYVDLRFYAHLELVNIRNRPQSLVNTVAENIQINQLFSYQGHSYYTQSKLLSTRAR